MQCKFCGRNLVHSILLGYTKVEALYPSPLVKVTVYKSGLNGKQIVVHVLCWLTRFTIEAEEYMKGYRNGKT